MGAFEPIYCAQHGRSTVDGFCPIFWPTHRLVWSPGDLAALTAGSVD